MFILDNIIGITETKSIQVQALHVLKYFALAFWVKGISPFTWYCGYF